MEKPKNLLLHLIVVALLVGCGEITAPTPVLATVPPSATALSTSTSTSIPTPTIRPSATFAPTRTPVPSITATKTLVVPAEARLRFHCLEVAQQFPDGATSTGILVLESRETVNGRWLPETYLLDMSTGQSLQIVKPGERQIYHFVSPDRKLLAYESFLFDEKDEIIQEDLVVAAADGQRIKSIPLEKGWGRFLGWLTNERIIINIAGMDPVENTGQKPATLLALNPFSGARQALRADFPGIYDALPLPNWFGWSLRTYDSVLTRAAYVKITEKNDLALALWDLPNHKLLATLFPYQLNIPVWSPDGSRLVVNAPIAGYRNEELFLISREGQIEQLTNLNTYAAYRAFSTYSWSPDGKAIAAWMMIGLTWDVEVEVVELVIIDVETRQMTNYCIKLIFGNRQRYYAYPPAPIWSPDGAQLVLYDWYNLNHSRVILVDRVQGFAAQIGENKEPMGWMLVP